MLPIFKYFTTYFPKAHREVTKVCVVNNVRYNPGRDPADINWARGKSPDQLGSAFRHIAERQIDGKIFEDVSDPVAEETGIKRVYVLAEAMWRIGAALELDIEEQEAKVPFQPLDWNRACEVDSTLPAPVTGCDCASCTRVRTEATTGV